MSLDQQRKDIVTEIERARAAWTTYPLKVEYDNRDQVDLSTLTTPYLLVDIVWGKGEQLSVEQLPLVCDYGMILLAAGVKGGEGTSQLLTLLNFFRPYLQLRNPLGTVKTKVAVLGNKPIKQNGFYYQTMSIPFWSTAQAPAVP